MFGYIQNYKFSPDNPLHLSIKTIEDNETAAVATPVIERLGLQFSETKLTSIDECLMTDEEITKHSLINNKTSTPLTPLPDLAEIWSKESNDESSKNQTQAVFNMAGNFIGSGLFTGGSPIKDGYGLEGSNELSNFSIWKWVLNDIYENFTNKDGEEAKVVKNILVGTDEFITLNQEYINLTHSKNNESLLTEVALKYANKIKNLKPHESQVISGGYINEGGGSGHAQIYEFVRNSDVDGTFDVLIHQSTGFELADYVSAGNKEKVKPLVKFASVPEHVLLFSEDGKIRPGFVQSIIELSVLKKWDLNRVVDDKDVLRVFDYLLNYNVPVSLEECGAITGQRSGSCVAASTKAWIRRHSRHLGLYKQIMFHATLRILMATYKEVKSLCDNNTHEGELSRRVLGQLSRNLLRKIAKLAEGKDNAGVLISPELALQARATAHQILNHVNTCQSAIDNNRKQTKVNSDLSKINFLEQQKMRSALNLTSEFEEEEAKAEAETLPNLTVSIGKDPVQAIIQVFISQTHGVNKNLEIHQLVDQLPIPTIPDDIDTSKPYWINTFKHEYWDSLTEEKLKETLPLLEDLLNSYINFNKYSQDFLPRRFATVLPLFALTHYLALKIDSKKGYDNVQARLEHYKMPTHFSSLNLEDLIYLNRNEFLRIQEAKKYIETFNQLADSPDCLFASEKTTMVVKDSIKESLTNATYWKALLLQDKNLEKLVDEEGEKRWPKLEDAEIERRFQILKEIHNQWTQDKKDWNTYQIYKQQVNEWERQHKNWSQIENNSASEPKKPVNPFPFNPPAEPGKEPLLEREKNLPPITKHMLVMESASTTESEGVLSKCDYKHIDILRHVLYKTNLLMNRQNDASQTMILKAYRKDQYSYEAGVEKPSIYEENDFYNSITHYPKQQRKISLNHSTFFTETTNRKLGQFNQDKAEGKALESNYEQNSLLERLTRTASQWELTPNQMIYEVSKNMDDLKDPSFQGLFYRLFFRSPIPKASLGAGELIIHNQALLDNAKTFINKGLNHFENSKDKIDGARFFFEFSFYLAKYLVDAGHPDKAKDFILSGDLKNWLNNDEVKKLNCSPLYFYSVLHHSVNPKPSDEDYADLYANWIQYQINPNHSQEWDSPAAMEMAQRHIVSLTSKLSKEKQDPSFCDKLGKEISARLNLIDLDDRPWTVDKLGMPYISCGGYKINLVSGVVYTPFGVMQGVDVRKAMSLIQQFGRIFQEKNQFQFQAFGKNIISFKDPKLGDFRISYESREKPSFIQRYFPELKQWCEYRIPSPGEGISRMLISDHAHWFPVNGDNNCKCYITSLKEQEIKYMIKLDGTIVEVDKTTGKPKKNGLTVDHLYLSSNLEALGIARFEFESKILCFKDEHNQIQKLTYPRYTSQDGNPLSFVNDKEGRLVWSDNSQYAIPAEMPQGYLGQIKQYLYLEPKSGKGPAQILVPFQPIVAKNIPVANGKIDTDNEAPLMDVPPEKKSVEQHGLFQYFVYQIENEQIKSTSLESKIYLAYIYMAEKKYQEAIDLLRSLKPTDALSPMANKIFKLILEFNNGEDHPDGKMVRLKALSVLMQEMDKNSKQPTTDYLNTLFSKSENDATLPSVLRTIAMLAQDTANYLQSINNTSIGCRLTFEEEEYVLSGLHEELSNYAALIKAEIRFDISRYLKQIKSRLTILQTKTEPKNPTVESAKRLPEEELKFNLLNDLTAGGDRFSETTWLSQGSLSSLYTRTGEQCNIKYNGKLFLEVYRIAKHGKQGEKQDMRYRLLHWKVQMPREPQLDLLIKLIHKPESFPALIDVKNATPEQQFDFLVDVQLKYAATQLNFPKLQDLGGRTLRKPAVPSGATNYPVNMYTAFDTKQVDITQIDAAKIPVAVGIKKDATRWETLKSWQAKFLQKDELQSTVESKTIEVKFFDDLLSEKDSSYKKSLIEDLKQLQEECDEGRIQQESIEKKIISRENCISLIDLANQRLDAVRKERIAKEAKILSKANVKSFNKLTKQAELARIGGSVDKAFSLEDSVTSLLSLDRRHYQSKNQHLNQDPLVKEIAELTLDVADLKSYEAQLSRIIKDAQSIESIDLVSDPTRRYLCQKLSNELENEYHFEKPLNAKEEEPEPFTIEERVAFRVFAGETGMIPFKKQIDLIRKMIKMSKTDPKRYRDIVIQLIMGGGKTSVIATILLYLASQREGRMPLFLVPGALYDTVKSNFSDAMLQAFKKETLAFEYNRDDLVPHKLKALIKQLKKSKDMGLPIVMSVNTLQCFELELISQARSRNKLNEKLIETKAKHAKLKSAGIQGAGFQVTPTSSQAILQNLENQKVELEKQIKASDEKLQLLLEVNNLFPEHSDALLDEVDVLLDCLQEVNFPDGDEISVEPVRNSLLHTIYSTMLRKDLIVETKEGSRPIADVVKLSSNEQTLMSQETYLQGVIPVIAKHLSNTFKPISRFLSGHQESFIRYVTGEINPALQVYLDGKVEALTEEIIDKDPKLAGSSMTDLLNDFEFLKHLKKLSASDNKEQKEAAHLIALTKHFLLELTPATLSKSGGRDYGPTPDKSQPGKMVPYLGVNTPATTEFGYHWEAAAYHYQWAAAFNPEPEEIYEQARIAETTAKYYIQKHGENFIDTAEYEEFFKFFGVELDKIHEPGKIELALQTISQDVSKRLDLQYDVVGRYINYRTERISSNGLALLDQLGSRRAMSGTPWNVEGYDQRLAERYKADKGTEGKIIHELVKRASEDKIHEVSCQNIRKFLGPVFDKKTPVEAQKIRGIIEAGGLFKQFRSNAEVAKGIAEFLKEMKEAGKVDPKMEGVLFFHKDPGQNQPNTLYVWRLGAENPERIGGTTKEALKAKGLDASNIFTFYDERHTTGTDIEQLPDAVNVLTFDEKMILRTMGQGIMRLRQFLFEQNVEIVATAEGRKSFVNGGKSIEDLILTAEKVQSIRKTKAMVRYYTQQINNIFRRHALIMLKKGIKNKDTLIDTLAKCEKFLVNTMQEDPFIQHGCLLDEIDTKEMLKKMLDAKLTEFKLAIRAPQSAEVKEATADANKLKDWITASKALPEKTQARASSIGIEQEVAVQVQKETNVQVEMAIEENVNIELRRYTEIKTPGYRPDKRLQPMDIAGMIKNLRNEKSSQSEISLQQQLMRFHYATLAGSERIPYENAFNQRIFGTEPFFFTYEGNEVVPVFHRSQRPPSQILAVMGDDNIMRWMLLSEHEADDVVLYLQRLYDLDDGQKASQRVWLIQPDGTLLVKGKHTQPFPMHAEGVGEGLLEINAFAGNVSYLDLKVAQTEKWLTKIPSLREIKIKFLKLKTAKNKAQRDILCKCNAIINADKDAKHNPNQRMSMARAEREKLHQGMFKPAMNEIKDLSPAQIEDLNVEFVKYLGFDCPDEHVRSQQFEAINPFQAPYLVADQMKWLPVDKVQYLKTNVQIYVVDDAEPYRLSEKQVTGLTEDQRDLIPFVNPDYYKNFTEQWQIQEVPIIHLNKINPAHFDKLSKSQVKSMTDATYFKRLSPKMFGWVHGNLLNDIPHLNLVFVSRDQIQEITNPDLIKQLETIAATNKQVKAGLWTSWIKPSQVKDINAKTQLKYLLTPELIENIDENWVQELDAEKQIPLIPQKFVKLLNKAEHIKKCPNGFVHLLNEEQQKSIGANQVPFLRDLQIAKVTDVELFCMLTAKENTELKHINQMEWIDDSQLGWVQLDQVKGLTSDQLVELKKLQPTKWNDLQKEITETQIEKFDSKDLMALLSAEQITKHVKVNQIPFLTEAWQIQACPNNLVKNLSATDQVPQIKADQVAHLEGQKQIEACPYEYVKQLEKKQYALITNKQAEYLSEKQIGEMDTQAEIAKLQQTQWTHLSERGVKALSPDDVEKLKNDPALQDKVQFISAPPQPDAPKPDPISTQTNTQPPAPTLTDAQIAVLTDEEQINALAVDKFKLLNTEKGVRAVSFWNVQHLTREQLAQRSTRQFILYTMGVLLLGVASSIVALLAHATLIPLGIWLVNEEAGNSFMATLHANPKRLYRYFDVYVNG